MANNSAAGGAQLFPVQPEWRDTSQTRDPRIQLTSYHIFDAVFFRPNCSCNGYFTENDTRLLVCGFTRSLRNTTN